MGWTLPMLIWGYQKIFDKVIVLGTPIMGKPLILYTNALNDSLGALISLNEEGKKHTLLLKPPFIPFEINYPFIKKHCLGLIFILQKVRHYMLSHNINLVSRINPL